MNKDKKDRKRRFFSVTSPNFHKDFVIIMYHK